MVAKRDGRNKVRLNDKGWTEKKLMRISGRKHARKEREVIWTEGRMGKNPVTGSRTDLSPQGWPQASVTLHSAWQTKS